MLILVQGLGWLQSNPASQSARRNQPLTGCSSITRRSLSRSLSVSLSLPPRLVSQTGTCRHTNKPNMPIFGRQKETGAPRENPHRHGEKCATPHLQWPQPGIDFSFLINIITKRYSRSCCTWNGRTFYQKIFKDCVTILKQMIGSRYASF